MPILLSNFSWFDSFRTWIRLFSSEKTAPYSYSINSLYLCMILSFSVMDTKWPSFCYLWLSCCLVMFWILSFRFSFCILYFFSSSSKFCGCPPSSGTDISLTWFSSLSIWFSSSLFVASSFNNSDCALSASSCLSLDNAANFASCSSSSCFNFAEVSSSCSSSLVTLSFWPCSEPVESCCTSGCSEPLDPVPAADSSFWASGAS